MDKVALITGASAGIGLATADRLATGGWTVIGASRRARPSDLWTAAAIDVDQDQSVRDAVASVVATHGRLDAVVAGAGWGLAGPVEQTPIDEAKHQLETNFFGAVRLVHEALPVMRKQQRGRIVLISSIGGAVAIPFQAFYSASKFAMEGYGEALAYEVAPFGISVTLVEPGNVRTEFTAQRRTVGDQGGAGPYAVASKKALDLMERDEANGVDPDRVAAVIERILVDHRPPRRVSVGKMDERIGIMAKRLLPFSIFERAAKGSLGV